jgi:hypothetical protein
MDLAIKKTESSRNTIEFQPQNQDRCSSKERRKKDEKS